MWLCSKCFDQCQEKTCPTCQIDILIYERYLLQHCIKVVPRMCFDAWDIRHECAVVLYQGNDGTWHIIASSDEIDIRNITQEIQEFQGNINSQPAQRSKKYKLHLQEELLDPLDPNSDSQFVIQLPEKRGWWDQKQSRQIWNSSQIHPAFLLLFIAVVFFIISSGLTLFMM